MKAKFAAILVMLFFWTTCFATYLPPAQGKHGMVTSSQHYASQIGLHILKEGGNAIDAAVAMGYALAVVHPCCGNLGGGGFMVIHLAHGKSFFIDFREKAPAAISSQLFLNKQGKIDKKKSQHGYLPVGIPGTVMGYNTALKRFGTMSLKQVITPAINLAKKGYRLERGDTALFNTSTKYFKQESNVRNIFLKNGRPYKAGEILKQPALAKTLTAIRRRGSKVFYRGWIAKDIVKASKKNHGVLSLRDFKNYTVETRKLLTCHYRGYTILTPPPPSSGATICEMFNILKGYPLGKLGFHSAASVHYNIEAMRYAFADRNHYLGDPDFVKNPIKKLLSPQYAKKVRSEIEPEKAGDSKKLGLFAAVREKPNTTNFTVVDRHGNAVDVTTTLNGFFGSKMIAGRTGFFLNNELDDFALKIGATNMFGLVQGHVNLIEPNKRPLSSMSPTIVLHHHQLFMVVGAAGGSSIITSILQTIEHVIDYHMDINTAINEPRYHMQWLPDTVFMAPYAFSPDTAKLLKKMGYHLQIGLFGDKTWGQVTAITVDPTTGELYGAHDNRYPSGLAIGY